MVKQVTPPFTTPLTHFLFVHQKAIYRFIFLFITLFVYFKPQQAIDLWLSRDQQGSILFTLGKYEKASQHYSNGRWAAFSAYANEDFTQAIILYDQYDDALATFSQANAFAQNREYIKARNNYQKLLKNCSHGGELTLDQEVHTTASLSHEHFDVCRASQKNVLVVQAIIDETNNLSASQQPEQGESNKELGNRPQAADGAQRKQVRLKVDDTLSAEQLLADSALNDMWLRQVQKNPQNFLAQKFYLQSQKEIHAKAAHIEKTKEVPNE